MPVTISSAHPAQAAAHPAGREMRREVEKEIRERKLINRSFGAHGRPTPADDALPMTTQTQPLRAAPSTDPPDDGRRARLGILLLVQTAIATTSAIEASLLGLTGFGPAIPALLTLIGAGWTAWLVKRLKAPGPRTFKTIRRLQVGWVLFALVDLGLSLVMAQRLIPLTGLATRIALPIWIYVLARKEFRRVVA